MDLYGGQFFTMTHPAHEEEVFPRDGFRPRPDYFANHSVERDRPQAALVGLFRGFAATEVPISSRQFDSFDHFLRVKTK